MRFPSECLLCLLLSLPPSAAGQAPADADLLRSGQPLVDVTQTDASGGAVTVRLLVHARPEALWEVLLSCDRSFEYVDGLRACEVVEGGVERALVRQSVKKHWLLPRLDYVIEFRRAPFTAIAFRKVEGDLRLLEGQWRFDYREPEGETLVTHAIRVEPSFPVPRWLVRRSIARDVPDMLLCLRALAGGSANAAQEREDRMACPRPGEP